MALLQGSSSLWLFYRAASVTNTALLQGMALLQSRQYLKHGPSTGQNQSVIVASTEKLKVTVMGCEVNSEQSTHAL